jgi:hypothetical protein
VGTYLQRSLNRVPDEDGQRLVEMLRQPREAPPIDVPNHRPRRRETSAPEPTLLDAQAVALEPKQEESQVVEATPEPRIHTEIQAKLRDIGSSRGSTCGLRIGERCGTTGRLATGVSPTYL